MSVTKLVIRGFMNTAHEQIGGGNMSSRVIFDMNAMQELEIEAGSHMSVNESGSVRIGYDPVNIQEDVSQPPVFRYSREVTYPAWRVVEVRTEHDEQS